MYQELHLILLFYVFLFYILQNIIYVYIFLCLYFYILVIVYKEVRNYMPRNKFLYQKIRLAYWLIIIYAEKNCHRLYHQSYFVIFRVSFLAFFVADFNSSSSEFENLCLHCDNESLCSDIISTQKKFMTYFIMPLKFLVKKSKYFLLFLHKRNMLLHHLRTLDFQLK